MKKIKLLLVIVVIASTVSAQNSVLMNAFNYLRKSKLVNAKEAIDAASEHPDTKDLAKTWFYKANIYLAISASKEPNIASLDTLALEKAYEYYQKSILMDKEINNDMLSVSNPFLGISMVSNVWFDRGKVFWDSQNYLKAYNAYSKSNKYMMDNSRALQGMLDPNYIRDMINNSAYMSALSCYYFQESNRDTAVSLAKELKSNLKYLVSENYKAENIYNYLANIYINEKDTTKAISVVNKAEKLFPDSTNTLILKFNVYYWAGKTVEASAIIQKIKDKDPKNPIIHFNIGTILEKTNFEESEKAYLTAIDLKPNYWDAIFNLGALYFNKFIELKKKASDIYEKNPDESDKIGAESKTFLVKARPYVEKCFNNNPNERATVFMLKQIYANSNELDKAKEMDAILKNLKK